MRILMTTHHGAGHVGPMIPFARALLRAGHDVLVAAPRAAGPMVARAGLDLHAFEEADPALEAPVVERIRSLSADEANEHILRDLFGRIRGRAALPAVLDAVAGWGPDLVVPQISEPAGPAAAERHGVPHARVGIGLAIGEHWGVGAMSEALDDLRAHIGTPRDPSRRRLGRSPHLTLAPPSLELPPPPPRRALRFRDPAGVRPLADWWHGSDAPLAYGSFGSGPPGLGVFEALSRAGAGAVGGPARGGPCRCGSCSRSATKATPGRSGRSRRRCTSSAGCRRPT